MVEEPKTSDIAELKKELAEIKNEMMRKELEEIKLEKMRKELEEMKADQAQKTVPQQYYAPYRPQLSIITVAFAGLALLIAGYIAGTLYPLSLAGELDKYLAANNIPIGGALLLAIVSVVLAFIGLGFVTIAKK
jgi:hypothetical protein